MDQEKHDEPLDPRLEDETLAAAGELDLDEDLFDFPDLDTVEPIAMEAPAPPAHPTPAHPAAAIELDAVLDAGVDADTDGGDVFGDEPVPVATEAPVSTPEPVLPEPRSADGDDFTPGDPLEDAPFDLDEDLFDFEDLDAVMPAPLSAQPASSDFADLGSVADEDVADALARAEDLDLAPAPVPAASTLASEVATQPAGQSTDQPGGRSVDDTTAEAQPASTGAAPTDTLEPAAAPVEPTVPVATTPSETFDPRVAPPAPRHAEPARRGRIVEILAVCFLVVNVTMVFFAWQAGDEFRQTLAQVSGSVSDALDRQPGAMGSVPVDPGPNVQVTPDLPPIEGEPVVELPDLTRTAFELARTRLEEGEYEAARRGLQRLLANQDRAALEPAQVVEAEILIARSYYLEGLQIREDAR